MKKKKITFSIYNYGQDSGPEVLKIKTAVKALGILLAGSNYENTEVVQDAKKHTIWIMATFFILNEVLSCLKIEEIEETNQP